MIKRFVEAFMNQKANIRAAFKAKMPEFYDDIVKQVVLAIERESAEVNDREEWDYDLTPHSERIHAIDDGSYQGTLLFVIASKGYQPSAYWFVKVDYGSCSGCDTLAAIKIGYDYEEDYVISDEQLDGLMTLALHIVQGLKPMQEDADYDRT